MEIPTRVLKFLHMVGIAGLGLGAVWLLWMHLQVAVFGYFLAYEWIPVIRWGEVVMAFYILGYYCWMLRNHFSHHPPWRREEEED